MNPISAPLLRNLTRVMALSDNALAHLSGLLAQPMVLGPRRKFISEHRPCNGFYVALSGWLSEYRQLPNGGRQVLNFRMAGDVIGMECLLYNVSLNSVSTLTECTIAAISRDMFERMQSEFPRLATAFLLLSLYDRMVIGELAINLGRRSAFSRVAHLLLELHRRAGGAGLAGEHGMPFPLTQQDIADCTGLTSPYVNRVMREMRNRGLVETTSGMMTLHDLPELAKAAGFSPRYLEISAQTHWQQRMPQDGNRKLIQPPLYPELSALAHPPGGAMTRN